MDDELWKCKTIGGGGNGGGGVGHSSQLWPNAPVFTICCRTDFFCASAAEMLNDSRTLQLHTSSISARQQTGLSQLFQSETDVIQMSKSSQWPAVPQQHVSLVIKCISRPAWIMSCRMCKCLCLMSADKHSLCSRLPDLSTVTDRSVNSIFKLHAKPKAPKQKWIFSASYVCTHISLEKNK